MEGQAKTLRLWCMVVGSSDPSFHVDITSDKLGLDLQEAIMDKKQDSLGFHDSSLLRLYVAKTDAGGWIEDTSIAWVGEEEDKKEGEKKQEETEAKELAIGNLPDAWRRLKKKTQLPPRDRIAEFFQDCSAQTIIHVLVAPVIPAKSSFGWSTGGKRRAESQMLKELLKAAKMEEIGPPPAKLPRLKDVGLIGLWERSALEHQSFPEIRELAEILRRPLPFKLPPIQRIDPLSVNQLFDRDALELTCADLSSLLDGIWFKFGSPPSSSASEYRWISYYDDLLAIPLSIFQAMGLELKEVRDRSDETETTEQCKRPDVVLHIDGLVFLRGEERRAQSKDTIDKPLEELTTKMRWDPIFYGDLPYIIGYAAWGPKLEIVAITREKRIERILVINSIVTLKADAFKVFYNLTFLLDKLAAFSSRPYRCELLPFTEQVKDKRTLKLLDYAIQRTITSQQWKTEDNYERLVDIYQKLKKLNKCSPTRTYLQTVVKLYLRDEGGDDRSHSGSEEGKTKYTIVMQLSPLGFDRRPKTTDEVCKWLWGMLTALKHWHSTKYCHGDLRWRNIVYVPAHNSGYWILIDMDESHKPNTKVID